MLETYSAAVVALRAASGQVAWVFQTVHHDLWDMDVPAQPSLIDLNIGGTRRLPRRWQSRRNRGTSTFSTGAAASQLFR